MLINYRGWNLVKITKPSFATHAQDPHQTYGPYCLLQSIRQSPVVGAPERASLLPTADEWIFREQVELVWSLSTILHSTLTVSNQVPNLNQYLGIMWVIEDLLDVVSSGGTNYGSQGCGQYSRQANELWRNGRMQ